MRLVWIAVLVASSAAAQSTPAAAPEQKTARLLGQVMSVSGDAIRKATVVLQGTGNVAGHIPDSYSGETDAEGKFVFEEVTPGRYLVSAEKEGFVRQSYGARSFTSSGTPLNVTAGRELTGIDIKMTPQGVVAGRVVDEDGDPVMHAQVRVMTSRYLNGKRMLIAASSSGVVQTDDQGAFRAGGLAPGRYYIMAEDSRSRGLASVSAVHAAKPGQRTATVTTYYPNALDMGSASALDVTAGTELRGMDIRLRREKVFRVQGKVVDPAGEGQVQSLAMVSTGNPIASPNMITARVSQGEFVFPSVLPGSYMIRAAQVGNAKFSGTARVTVTDADIEDVTLTLSAGVDIPGTVAVEGGDLASLWNPGASARIDGGATSVAPAAMRMIFLQEASGDLRFSSSASATVDPNGAFTLNNVAPGTYTLNVNLPPGTYLKAARFEGQDVLGKPFEISAAGRIDVLFSTKPAILIGAIKDADGHAMPGVYVTAWSKSGTGMFRSTVSDQSGSYHLNALAPGDYYVAAWESIDTGLFQVREFLSLFTSRAAQVKLEEAGQETLDPKPIPAEQITAGIARLP